MPGVITHCICTAVCYNGSMPTHTIDQEWRGYYLHAEVHVPVESHEDHGAYFGTPYARTIYESGEVEILDLRIDAYNPDESGYNIEVNDPNVLNAAKEWLKERDYE